VKTKIMKKFCTIIFLAALFFTACGSRDAVYAPPEYLSPIANELNLQELFIHHDNGETKFGSLIQDNVRVLYEISDSGIIQLATFPSLHVEMGIEETAERLPQEIFHLDLLGDYVILSAGEIQGSMRNFFGDLYRVCRLGGGREAFRLNTMNNRFHIIDGQIYHHIWCAQSVRGWYRFRYDGSDKERLDEIISISSFQDGYIFGTHTAAGYGNFARWQPNSNAPIVLFYQEDAPVFPGYISNVGYGDIKISNNYVYFTVTVIGYEYDSELVGWREPWRTLYTAQFRFELNSSQRTLIYEETHVIIELPEPQLTPIIFTRMENGTMLDTRVGYDMAHTILTHFAAIETGDMSAFSDTLVGEDSVDGNHHIFLMLKYFPNTLESLLRSWPNSPDERDWRSVEYLALGGTGLFVEEIGLMRYGFFDVILWNVYRVVVTNDFGLCRVYMLLPGVDVPSRITRHMEGGVSQQEMIIHFISRNYPVVFLSPYWRGAMVDSGNWDAAGFSAHEFFPGDITVAVRFAEPDEPNIVYATRIYRLRENDFALLAELDGCATFFTHDYYGVVMTIQQGAERNLYRVNLYERLERDGVVVGRTWHRELLMEPILDVHFADDELEPLEDITEAATLRALEIRSAHAIDFHMSRTTLYVSDAIELTISHITDEFLAMFNDYTVYSRWGGDPLECNGFGQRGIGFSTNVPVSNFRFLGISGAEIRFIVEEELFALDELHPNTPLLVDWAARGSGAYDGFSFDDEFGVTRYFGFNYCAVGGTAFRFLEFFP